MRLGLVASVIAILGLFAGSAIAAEMVDNPVYQSWAKFKPGTTVVYNHEIAAGTMTMNMEMTQKLIEVTPEKATVEMTMTTSAMPNMNHPGRKSEIPAKIDKDQLDTAGKLPQDVKGEAKPLGKENVDVSGKAYECQVTQITGEQRGQKLEGKSWTTPDVPGNMVKVEMKSAGEQPFSMKMTLSKLDIKQ